MTEPRLADTAVSGSRPCELQAYRGRLFLTVADVARITDTDPRTVRRGIEAGDLPAIRINNTVRVPAARFWPEFCGLDPELVAQVLGLTPDEHNEAGPVVPTTEPATGENAAIARKQVHGHDDAPPAA